MFNFKKKKVSFIDSLTAEDVKTLRSTRSSIHKQLSGAYAGDELFLSFHHCQIIHSLLGLILDEVKTREE
jgi:hypothetical protein